MRRAGVVGLMVAIAVVYAVRREQPAESLVYDLTWEVEQSAGASIASGRLALAGELVMGPGGAVRFTRLDRSAMSLLGSDIAAGELVGPVAYLEDGAVAFDPAAPALFKHLMTGLAGELAVRGSPGMAVEETILGTAEVRYEREAGPALRRTRVRYTAMRGAVVEAAAVTVRSDGRVSLRHDGRIESLSQEDTVTAGTDLTAHTKLTLTLRGATRGGAVAATPATAPLERRVPGVITASAELDRQLLEQQVDGLSEDEFMADLRRLLDAPGPVDHRWLWRAVGLLQLEPGLCAELVPLFLDATSQGRALILDLLASTGHAEAQAAMRVAMEAASEDAAYGLLVQRFSLVTAPDAGTVAFLEAEVERADGDEGVAAAWALGAAAGRAGDDGVAAARALERFSATATPALLGAVANIDTPAATATLVRHAGDTDPEMRRAVAAGLRLHDGRGVDTLFALLGDRDLGVVRLALESLAAAPLGGEDLDRLGTLAPALPRAADDAVLAVLAAHLGPRASVRATLALVITRNATLAPAVATRARSLLSSLPG